MSQYGFFGIVPGLVPKGLAELRQGVMDRLRDAPLSDPFRLSLGGAPIARDLIDGYEIIHFPGVLFDTLPQIRIKAKKRDIVRRTLETPSTRWLEQEEQMRFLSKAERERTVAVQKTRREVENISAYLSATLYRIFKSMEGIVWQRDVGFRDLLPMATNAFLSPEEHWITTVNPRGGFSSPAMQFKGRVMMIADVLMNLAYPTTRGTFHFGLQRRCGIRRCINPAHYVRSWNPVSVEFPDVEELGFGYVLATGSLRGGKLPRYFWDDMGNKATYSASWKDYLDQVEANWRQFLQWEEDARKPTETEKPVDLTELLKKEAGETDKGSESIATAPRLTDFFTAIGKK